MGIAVRISTDQRVGMGMGLFTSLTPVKLKGLNRKGPPGWYKSASLVGRSVWTYSHMLFELASNLIES